MRKREQKKEAPQVCIIEDLPIEVRKNRGQKNLYLRVHPPDGHITLSAPAHVTDQQIETFVARYRTHILATQARILSLPYRNCLNYEDGDVIYIWGQPYRVELQTLEEGAIRFRVEPGERRAVLVAPGDAKPEVKEAAVYDWYRAELKRRIPARARKVEARMGLQASEYRVRKMTTRWGTCSVQARRVWLSVDLVRFPDPCLEYILTHELTHLLERQHNERFYALMATYYPAWREAEAILQGKVISGE